METTTQIEAQPATGPITRPLSRLVVFPRSRQLLVGSLALVLAGAGQALLFADWGAIPGVILFVLAVLLGAAVWSSELASYMRVSSVPRAAGRFRLLLLRLLGIGGALALSIGSILAYRADPGAVFGLQGVLWIAGMALLAISCLRWRPVAARAMHWEVSWTGREGIFFGGLVALSLITHLAFLSAIPWRFHFDEGYAYQEMMRFYQGPTISLFSTTWERTGLPSLWFGIGGLLAHITGPTLTGVRLSVALAGALTVIPVYLLARMEWGRLAGALAAFAVAVSAVFVHYSRVAILNVTTPLAWTVCFYFLLKGLRTRRPTDYMWAGLAAGLSMYTYYGTRLLPYLLAIFFAYLLLLHFRAMRSQIGNFALAAVGFLAGFGPLLGYFTLNPQVWAGRGLSTLNVPATIPSTWDAVVTDWNILAPIAWQNFLGLSVLPGKDSVYFAPFMLAPEAAMSVLGLGLLALRWRRQPSAFLLLLWVLGSLFLGGVMLDWTTVPNFAHWAPAFPVFFLALALPLTLYLRPLLVGGVPRTRRIWKGVLAALLVLDLAANAYSYLVAYPPKVRPDLSLEAVQGRFLESLPPNTHLRVVGNSWVWSPLNPLIARMMSKEGTFFTRLYNPGLELPVAGEPDKNLAFIFYPDMLSYLSLVQSYYPGGKTSEWRTPDGTLIALGYEVEASHTQADYGVFASFQPAREGGSAWQGQVDKIGDVSADTHLIYPVNAEWHGALYITSSSPTTFSVAGARGARVWLEGQPVSEGQPVVLEPGWAQFVVAVRLETPTPLQFLLEQGGVSTEPDKFHLWPMTPGQGLATTVLSGFGTAHRIDQAVGAGLLFLGPGYGGDTDPDMLPLSVLYGSVARIRWEGEILTGEGNYQMELRSDASLELYVDGVSVARSCAVPGEATMSVGTTTLTAGRHRVRLDYATQAGAGQNRLEWFWTRPDGVREVVPPHALRVALDLDTAKPLAWPEAPSETVGCAAP